MSIDKDRLTAYVSEIKTSVAALKGYKEVKKEDFLSSQASVRDVKYCFIIAGQAAIDICYHLTAKLLKKAPADYSNCFEVLADLSAFSKETLQKMASMAKFRNLLVHHYIKVDDTLVYEKLKDIGCFEDFLKNLDDLLNNQVEE